MGKYEILLTVAAFGPQKHDFGFAAECIPNLVSKILRHADSIERGKKIGEDKLNYVFCNVKILKFALSQRFSPLVRPIREQDRAGAAHYKPLIIYA
ncbi:hypothetical protein [uncultured Nostoc sp.]|uniref:hypothetical protein n=1 Tax=uncultured Nostoc sp. TaxID=340711 RepID=UPI0035CC8562